MFAKLPLTAFGERHPDATRCEAGQGRGQAVGLGAQGCADHRRSRPPATWPRAMLPMLRRDSGCGTPENGQGLLFSIPEPPRAFFITGALACSKQSRRRALRMKPAPCATSNNKPP